MQRSDPIATYRLQLTPTFGFAQAIELLDHLGRLGVSHLYLSPIAQAVPESAHGYDVVDPTRVRAELGGAAGFEALLEALAARSMAVIVDHVPNHMAATHPELNRWWWSLLRDGPDSAAADWFDVDWEQAGSRVIVPVLDAPLAEAVAAGEIVLDGDTVLVHGSHRLPLAAGTAGVPLPELLDRQHYRLQHWCEPERNVRRFFAVDGLVAVRVERPAVAAVVDTLPARYADHPGFGGVRVDHVDGLADPAGYLARLRDRVGPDALLYVEKILAAGEELPAAWPVDGTTGYEFARIVDHVLLAGDARAVFARRWIEDGDDTRSFAAHVARARAEVIDGSAGGVLAPDFERLARVALRALRVPEPEQEAVVAELRRLTIELPRYRTYLPDDRAAAAVIGAISSGPVARTLLDPITTDQVELRTRWQQLTGAVMAKGAEDRAFYRYLRLPSLSEVGGDPGAFGITVDEFHADQARRRRDRPRTMLAASTHDTKRSEDVRARSVALTWRALDRRVPTAGAADVIADDWAEWSRKRVAELVEQTGLDAVAVRLGLHTAVCTPGLDVERLTAFLVKAGREAAVRTGWDGPVAGYEERLGRLAGALLGGGDPGGALHLDAIAPAVSLAATTLRLTSPGVPDIYQGGEGFTYRLVDPDNRVPPDWPALVGWSADERTVAEAWADGDPAVKTVLVRTLLALRRRRPVAFGPAGEYAPIAAGEGAVAYARGGAVVVVARRGLAAVEGSLTFPPGRWYDVLDPGAPSLTGTVQTASIVGTGVELTLPVAVFELDD